MISIIFDIDGVLFDVQNSFYSAIKETVYFYLKNILKQNVSKDIVSDDDIKSIKSIGGFNDDWDVTCGLLYYYVSFLESDNSEFKSDNELINYKIQNTNYKQYTINKTIKSFTEFLENSKIDIKNTGLLKILELTKGKNKHLVLYGDDILKNNLVKRIFQEFYWGREFSKIYGDKNLFYNSEGFINREKLLIDKDILEKFYNNRNIILSIATGRERIDAEYSLKKYDLLKYFSHIITISEIKDKELRKPNPYSLYVIEDTIEGIREKGESGNIDKRFYIGDQIDDIVMANTAKEKFDITSIAYIHDKDEKRIKVIEKYKPDYIFTEYEEIFDIMGLKKNLK